MSKVIPFSSHTPAHYDMHIDAILANRDSLTIHGTPGLTAIITFDGQRVLEMIIEPSGRGHVRWDAQPTSSVTTITVKHLGKVIQKIEFSTLYESFQTYFYTQRNVNQITELYSDDVERLAYDLRINGKPHQIDNSETALQHLLDALREKNAELLVENILLKFKLYTLQLADNG